MLVELDSGKVRYSALAGISAAGDARHPPLRHLVGKHDGERVRTVGDDDGGFVRDGEVAVGGVRGPEVCAAAVGVR